MSRGYGPQVSDEASSQWLGRMAIRRALWALDGRIERTALAQEILDRFHESPEEIVKFANKASAAAFGELAPLVFDYAKRGDALAVAIVGEAAADGERMIARLLDLGASSVYLHGGISEPLAARLRPAIRKYLKKPMNVDGVPLEGATLLARRLTSRRAGQARGRSMSEVGQTQSRMLREAREAPEAVARMLTENADLAQRLGALLRRKAPPFAVTCARGSSDNAATFAKYLLEIRLGLVTASVGPSIRSVYAAAPNVANALFLAISQSGRSPDLQRLAEAARAGGAITIAMVNDAASPLAEACEHRRSAACRAGAERGGDEIVDLLARRRRCSSRHIGRTTRSFWTSCSGCRTTLDAGSGARLARRRGAPRERRAPLCRRRAASGLALAQEAALKLKETCGIHAEALSAAELMHGPLTLAGPNFPVLVFSQHDEALSERRRSCRGAGRARRAGDRSGTADRRRHGAALRPDAQPVR